LSSFAIIERVATIITIVLKKKEKEFYKNRETTSNKSCFFLEFISFFLIAILEEIS